MSMTFSLAKMSCFLINFTAKQFSDHCPVTSNKTCHLIHSYIKLSFHPSTPTQFVISSLYPHSSTPAFIHTLCVILSVHSAYSHHSCRYCCSNNRQRLITRTYIQCIYLPSCKIRQMFKILEVPMAVKFHECFDIMIQIRLQPYISVNLI